MASLKSANVTKLDAGGSGDNYIGNGLIKSVEKVWTDSYAMGAATAIASGSTLDLAVLPPGCRVTGIELFFPSLSTGAALTGTTISIGDGSSATRYLNAGEAASGVLTLKANAVGGIMYTPTGTDLRIKATFGRIATTTTNSTIKSIVRYT